MEPHSQTFARIAEQLEQQNAEWQDVRDLLENIDPRALLAADQKLLTDIETACNFDFSPPSSKAPPPRGLRG